MYVNIIIYSNKLLLFVWSTLKKEKKKKGCFIQQKTHLCLTRLFKSFEFGNGSRMSDEKAVIFCHKFVISCPQNRKWQKQAIKNIRINKN